MISVRSSTVLLLFLLLVITRPSATCKPAEPPGDTTRRLVPLTFGVRLGINQSNTNFNLGFPPPTSPVATTWRSGFTGGLLMAVRLSKQIAIQQEYLFTQVGGAVDELGVRYTMNYLSLPLRVQYYPGRRVGLYAGPQFDLLLSASQESQGETESIIHTTETRSFGLSGGVLIRLSSHLLLDLGYMQGLNHIGLKQGNHTREFKWQSVQAGVSFVF